MLVTLCIFLFFFFNDTATTEIYTLSLHDALPISQGLSLNPVQISGPCGRLLCCLHYEHDFYVQSRKRFPKEGKVLRTSVGLERVLAVDIFRERVTLRGEEGSTRIVPLGQLNTETGV